MVAQAGRRRLPYHDAISPSTRPRDAPEAARTSSTWRSRKRWGSDDRKHPVHLRQPRRVPLEGRIARLVQRRPAIPADGGDRRDVGAAGHRHPGLAPDQVQGLLAGQADAGLARSSRAASRASDSSRGLRPRPKMPPNRRYTAGCPPARWVGDDHVGTKPMISRRSRGGSRHIDDDHVGRRQLAQAGGSHPSCRPPWAPAEGLPRMNAEPRAPDQLIGEAQIADQLGQDGTSERCARRPVMGPWTITQASSRNSSFGGLFIIIRKYRRGPAVIGEHAAPWRPLSQGRPAHPPRRNHENRRPEGNEKP